MRFPISTIEVFYYIEEFPNSTAEEICQGVGLRLSTIKGKLSLLAQNSLVICVGNPRIYRIASNISPEILASFEKDKRLALEIRELRLRSSRF